MLITTLCYIEHKNHYLMLHRTKKALDINEGKWIGVGGKFIDRESPEECLLREVREETGLIVKPESVREFGRVMRRQKSDHLPDTVFEQENLYFLCETEERVREQSLDDYEKEAGFILRIVDIDEAISVNEAYHSENAFNEMMIRREERVLRIIKTECIDK